MGQLAIGIGADTYGYQMKEDLCNYLGPSFQVVDYGVGPDDAEQPYPVVGIQVAEAVAAGDIGRAILICGTGIGMAISANKVPGVRAAVAYDHYSVERSVLSNNCQVLALGARVIGTELARRICDQWLSLRFDTSSPSARKLEVIADYEAGRSTGAAIPR